MMKLSALTLPLQKGMGFRICSGFKMGDELYNTLGHKWWDETVGAFAAIRFFINPLRFNYFSKILYSQKKAGKKLMILQTVTLNL